ncbi:MAG: Na/Pi symporter [Planctomycetota bacterium]
MVKLAPKQSSVPLPVRVIGMFGLLYAFLVSIGLMSTAFKLLGQASANGLFEGLESPFAGFAVGILATVLLQSSSATTSLVVAAVSAGQLELDVAVFTIMGCNIGTTVTNTLVSMGHVRHDAEFRRAFAGATMHDFFNLMAVLIFFPLEMATGVLKSAAGWTSHLLAGDDSMGGKMPNPIKSGVKFVTEPLKSFVTEDLGFGTTTGGIILLVLALTIVFFSLIFITKTMRSLMAERLEKTLNKILARSGIAAIAIGAILTISVQSSSIVTSLMIPLFAAGILKLENGFPVTLGANIGTTVTALLAALTGSVDGLTIAFVHLFFNLSATLLIYPIPALRRIPVRLAVKLADVTASNRLYALAYMIIVFVILPLLGTIIFKS